ncbi:MAG TPA: DUF924 family protein [Burkholderiaceae bacterium]|nr:DUF924 family protein [Burkholderiaceae bacterium]
MTAPRDVLDFWFGPPDSPEYGAPRDMWFRKSEATDATIRARFGGAVEAALAGERRGWANGPRDALALVLMLDQFTRNIFRDTPRAFAGDEQALQVASEVVDRGADRLLIPVERWFIYLPFEHAESLSVQDESLRLFGQLAAEGHQDALAWAQKHHDVIARFGRFPHRNRILGRTSSAEELAFLAQPGSRF